MRVNMAMAKTSVAVLAKAPVPGRVKTRLIPAIGAHAAAALQERLTTQAVATALAARLGPVTLWCAPDPGHTSFRELCLRDRIALRRQPDGNLGARMLAAMDGGPTLVIGADCPALTAEHLRAAADALHQTDVVLIPAEDGGYVLIGTRAPQPALFENIAWGTSTVVAQTRARIASAGLALAAFAPLWDVDTEDDLLRLERDIPALSL